MQSRSRESTPVVGYSTSICPASGCRVIDHRLAASDDKHPATRKWGDGLKVCIGLKEAGRYVGAGCPAIRNRVINQGVAVSLLQGRQPDLPIWEEIQPRRANPSWRCNRRRFSSLQIDNLGVAGLDSFLVDRQKENLAIAHGFGKKKWWVGARITLPAGNCTVRAVG